MKKILLDGKRKTDRDQLYNKMKTKMKILSILIDGLLLAQT